MNLLERITVNPGVMTGKPCVRGMRVEESRGVERVQKSSSRKPARLLDFSAPLLDFSTPARLLDTSTFRLKPTQSPVA
jgi:hypothetical protein